MTNVTLGTMQVEDVIHAITDMTFNLTELANSQLKTAHLLTQAVETGIGRTKNAYNAQIIGFSTTTVSVCQSLINAIPSIY
jgi:hypothetical protein